MNLWFDPGRGRAARSATARAGKPVSPWLAGAATSRLGAGTLVEFLTVWAAVHAVPAAEDFATGEAPLGR